MNANPRLAEEDLVAWILTAAPGPGLLAVVGSDARWIERSAVRAALLLSGRTPRATALALVSGARREDWLALASRPGTDPLLAACARDLLERPDEDPSGRGD